MNLNEAKDTLRVIGWNRAEEGDIEDCEALDIAMNALEEIQQYKAIGLTPSMVEDLIKSCKKHEKNALENAHIVDDYREIGTVEEFKALKEKNTPYKPIVYEDKYYGCKCGEVLLEKWEEYPKKLMSKSWGLPYCLGCGQKLDWQ